MYEIKFPPKAAKNYKKIKDKKLKEKIREAIYKIAENPFIGQSKKGDLTGIYRLWCFL